MEDTCSTSEPREPLSTLNRRTTRRLLFNRRRRTALVLLTETHGFMTTPTEPSETHSLSKKTPTEPTVLLPKAQIFKLLNSKRDNNKRRRTSPETHTSRTRLLISSGTSLDQSHTLRDLTLLQPPPSLTTDTGQPQVSSFKLMSLRDSIQTTMLLLWRPPQEMLDHQSQPRSRTGHSHSMLNKKKALIQTTTLLSWRPLQEMPDHQKKPRFRTGHSHSMLRKELKTLDQAILGVLKINSQEAQLTQLRLEFRTGHSHNGELLAHQ